jgi:hypothetical protein
MKAAVILLVALAAVASADIWSNCGGPKYVVFSIWCRVARVAPANPLLGTQRCLAAATRRLVFACFRGLSRGFVDAAIT